LAAVRSLSLADKSATNFTKQRVLLRVFISVIFRRLIFHIRALRSLANLLGRVQDDDARRARACIRGGEIVHSTVLGCKAMNKFTKMKLLFFGFQEVLLKYFILLKRMAFSSAVTRMYFKNSASVSWPVNFIIESKSIPSK